MSLWKAFLDVIKPGAPEFKAQLSLLEKGQSDLVTALHLLESRGTAELRQASDAAAEFR